jgi:hypothetical protein
MSAAGTEYAMVGYRLEDTLSPHGTVSRGICNVNDDGFLVGITEHTKIERLGDRIISIHGDGQEELEPDATASMNIFGFAPSVFPLIEREFSAFLSRSAGDPKAEFYIPTLMTGLIESGDAKMRVLPTDARWFGMTYRQDRDAVQKSIVEFIEQGRYPRKLWPET